MPDDIIVSLGAREDKFLREIAEKRQSERTGQWRRYADKGHVHIGSGRPFVRVASQAHVIDVPNGELETDVANTTIIMKGPTPPAGSTSWSDFYDASDYFVSALASGGGAGTKGDPWTITEALSNVSAGEQIGVAAGTYSRASQDHLWNPAYLPSSSGSSGSPIKFVAQYPAALNEGSTSLYSKLTHDGAGGASASPTIGTILNTNHIEWWGFYLNENDARVYNTGSDGSGMVGIRGTGTVIAYCLLHCITDGPTNKSGIAARSTDNALIRDCIIRNNRCNGAPGNGAAILTYELNTSEIRYCEITDSQCAIHLKGELPDGEGVGHYGIDIHHNYCVDNDWQLMFMTGDLDNVNAFTNVYQNVVTGGEFGIYWNAGADSTQMQRCRWVNNTIYNQTENGLRYRDPGVWNDRYVQNNSFSDGKYGVSAQNISGSEPEISADYNLCYGTTGPIGSTTWATWQGWGFDANSTTSAPNYVDAANHDFTPDTGSPLINGGVDILNLLGGGTSASINIGAYIGQDDNFGPQSYTGS